MTELVMEWYEQIDSTQTRALQWAEDGAVHGSLVVANAQSAGRGRNGRVWHSPPGKGLYCSWIMKPQGDRSELPWLPLIAAAAICDAIRAMPDDWMLPVLVKWPNDLYVGTRKIGGLLVDARTRSGGCAYAVIGLGLSIGHLETDLPLEARDRSTSWVREGRSAPDLDDFILALHRQMMDAMSQHFGNTPTSKSDRRQFVKRMMPRVKMELPFRVHGTIEIAIPLDLDEEMRLLIELSDGSRIWLDPYDANST
jgi:BirA family biotin operon repressor/biotin-[acetyl-CoA-carboxylase] ligase